MQPNDFWPFAEDVICERCGEPVKTREAIAVVNTGQLAGMCHEDCEAKCGQ